MDIADRYGIEELFAGLVLKMLLEEEIISREPRASGRLVSALAAYPVTRENS